MGGERNPQPLDIERSLLLTTLSFPFWWGRNSVGLDWEGEIKDMEEEVGDMAGLWRKKKLGGR